MKCEYCGNTGGIRDDRGNCVSCGGVLPVISESVTIIPSKVLKYNGAEWEPFVRRIAESTRKIGVAFVEISKTGDVFIKGDFL